VFGDAVHKTNRDSGPRSGSYGLRVRLLGYDDASTRSRVLSVDGVLVAGAGERELLQNDAGHACALRTTILDREHHVARCSAGGSYSNPVLCPTGFFQSSHLSDQAGPAR